MPVSNAMASLSMPSAPPRANGLTVEELRQLPGGAVREIQEAYPDWRIHVAEEQEPLLAHALIVFQCPF
jgi:putative NADPH-quinone reductase